MHQVEWTIYKIGEIIIIKDHINFTPEHPLRGANDERFLIDLKYEPYSRKMIAKAKELALALNIERRNLFRS
jgi:purine-nucleoside phosphorylase